MILDEINKANIEAMKNKDVVARSIYSVAKNKIMLENISKREKGQELSDADVTNILVKLIKELSEEKENYLKAKNLESAENSQKQIDLISKFLPKMLSDEEIKKEILALSDRSIPSVMKHFKANFNGKVDMKKVQEILKGIS